LILLALAGCGKTDVYWNHPENGGDWTADTDAQAPFGGDELISCYDLPYQPDGGYHITSVEMEGDDLAITVAYMGASTVHEWMLCHAYSGLAANGPHYLALLHEDNDEGFEGSAVETLKFDISGICEWIGGDNLALCVATFPDDCDLTSPGSPDCIASEDLWCVPYQC
jgi:hypothetical protein